MQIKGSVLLVLGASIQWAFAAPWDVRVQERDSSVALSSTITSTSSSISSSAKESQESNDSFTSASTITHSQSTSLAMTTSTSNTAMLTSTASASSISATATSISATDSAFNCMKRLPSLDFDRMLTLKQLQYCPASYLSNPRLHQPLLLQALSSSQPAYYILSLGLRTDGYTFPFQQDILSALQSRY